MTLTTGEGLILIGLILQTGGLFYWAGGIARAVKEQDKRIVNLERWKERLITQ